ncbi:hypothetical protein [Streptomyces cyaneofuscatus]
MNEPQRPTVEGIVIRQAQGTGAGGIPHVGQTEATDPVHVELVAMHAMHDSAQKLDDETWSRVMKWLGDIRGARVTVSFGGPGEEPGGGGSGSASGGGAATVEVLSPRDFISRKKPQSLAERIACLGYYLARHRDMPHFTIKDIVQLNTEAAAHKFGNPSRDVDAADRRNGFLVTAGHGMKQVTPRGEFLVEALPDREAVARALSENPFKPRRVKEGSAKRASAEKED